VRETLQSKAISAKIYYSYINNISNGEASKPRHAKGARQPSQLFSDSKGERTPSFCPLLPPCLCKSSFKSFKIFLTKIDGFSSAILPLPTILLFHSFKDIE